MKPLDFESLIKKIICLECGNRVSYYPINTTSGIYVCKKCHAVYYREQGISVILPQKFLDKARYTEFLVKYKIFFDKENTLKKYFEKFMTKMTKRTRTWEDDDVEFWDEKYVKDCLELKTKKLVARAYLRDKILFQPLRKSGTKDHLILEVGCGEAISAQKLLLPYGNDFMYVATDYAFEALRFLQKRLKKSKNIQYFQCLGDAIPFKDETFDDIICLGVMHHMPKKEKHVLDLAKKLKPGGLFLSNEPYDRDYRLPGFMETIIQKIIEPRQSAHEERIDVRRYRKNFLKEGEIVNEYHCHTPVKTVVIRITGSLYERSVGFVRFVLLIDKITEKTIGRLWNMFSTGDCLILFKKSK